MTKLFNSKQELEAAMKEHSIRRLRIGDKVFCLVKTEGEFHLIDGHCAHQKHPLHEGSLNAFGEIICPLHFYRFNLRTGQEANRLCRGLEVYLLEISPSGVFASLGL